MLHSIVLCLVDGGWSDWKVGNCSVRCGGGVKEKFRICNNPSPSCGGKQCRGMKVLNEECNEFSCDVKGLCLKLSCTFLLQSNLMKLISLSTLFYVPFVYCKVDYS